MNVLAADGNTGYQNRRFWIFLAVVAIYPSLMSMRMETLFPMLIVLAGVLLGALFISVTDSKNFNKVFTVFLCAFLLRVFLATFLALYSDIKNGDAFFLGRDDSMYSVDGWWIAQLWQHVGITSKAYIGSIYLPSDGSLNYFDIWNARIYYLTGYSPLSLLYINCFAGSLTVVLMYLICCEAFYRRIGLAVAWTVALWPSLILWSTQNLKEAILIFSSVGVMWGVLRFRKLSFDFVSVFMFCLSVTALFFLRKFGLLIMALWVPFWLFFSSKLWSRKKGVCIAAMLFAVLLLLKFKGYIYTGIINFLFSGDREVNIYEWIALNRSVRAYGATAFMSSVDLSSPIAILKFMPIGMFICMFAPFPWQMGSLRQMISAPEMFVYYITFPYLIFGVVEMFRKRYEGSLLLFGNIFLNCAMFSLIDGNVGTIFRHRAVIVPFAILFLVAGYYHKRGYLQDE